jgi:hypothetical protein
MTVLPRGGSGHDNQWKARIDDLLALTQYRTINAMTISMMAFLTVC